ncbi:helix-turn-helix domain-containing protein [Actinokineospora auranticolor]|uniref:AcrR family transcriptional regulator n=1 Tax=Actinokineospora auranticolor TaxID=155976 RepID=A0A2S6GRZ7_9PSEU|nr:TetR/AcrR family transcriptional regulator [Actinokineospora auranticolor]PPK67947.1 AcrR family transcriptional regulator [Actinokineospora auranticolor]
MTNNDAYRGDNARPVVHERADAARNRRRILIAARGLFAQRGVDTVTMDQIAAAAGVGKGTLFRRFGDKSGLAAALVQEGERDLRDRVAAGPAPLGPGAAPARRLHAFFDAYLGFLADHLDLVHLAETARPGTRYRIAAYRTWHDHVADLLGQARVPGDRRALAHVLLAAVAADLQRAVRGEVPAERMRESVLCVVDATLAQAALSATGSAACAVNIASTSANVPPAAADTAAPASQGVTALTPGTPSRGAALWVQEG